LAKKLLFHAKGEFAMGAIDFVHGIPRSGAWPRPRLEERTDNWMAARRAPHMLRPGVAIQCGSNEKDAKTLPGRVYRIHSLNQARIASMFGGCNASRRANSARAAARSPSRSSRVMRSCSGAALNGSNRNHSSA